MQPNDSPTIDKALPGFIDYMTVERRLSPRTIGSYSEGVRYFARQVGDLPIDVIQLNHFIAFKARMAERSAGASRIAGVINAMKCLLGYARDVLHIPVLDTTAIKVPRPPRRQVTYLSPEELEKFLSAIPLRTWTGKPRLSGYCFRALVETLAATGMRISESLSLNRDSLNQERRQATIIGKGNKQRTVFFTDRALQWITRYVDLRTDSNAALFVTLKNKRLTVDSVEPMFRRNTTWAGLEKRVTPHVIATLPQPTFFATGVPLDISRKSWDTRILKRPVDITWGF